MASFFVDHLSHKVYGLEVLVTLFDSVLPIKLYLVFVIVDLFGFEFGLYH